MSLQTIAAIRRQRMRPKWVHVELVPRVSRDALQQPLDGFGNVSVQIPDEAALADIDFRPLHGLNVHLWTVGQASEARLRKAARLIAAVGPCVLRVFVPDAERDSAVMQRYEGGRWLPGVPLWE